MIEFLDTGYREIYDANVIRHGRVKDKLKPNIAGIGYIGYTSGKISEEHNFSLYKSWNDMLNRCYNENDDDYYLYGKLGITVEPRWFDFSIFSYEARDLPGYQNKLLYPDQYQLDKDYLQIDIPKFQRIYSKNTCMWISKHDNIMIMGKENKKSSCGYYGVTYKNNAWCTRIDNVVYGQFVCAEAAANLYNYIYPQLMRPFCDILLLNDNVPYIPYEELSNYLVPNRKQLWLQNINF